MTDSLPNKEEELANYWHYHSETWKTSGLTQSAYCAKFDINYASFVY